MRLVVSVAGLLLLGGALGLLRAEEKEPAAGAALFNGKDFTGWTIRPDPPEKKSLWTVVAAVKVPEGMPNALAGEKGTGVLLNGGDGKGLDLMTEAAHGDCELHVEFLVPSESNSGIYFHGQYEIQIKDSFGRKDAELEYRDCGGVYRIAAPRKNASKAPGEWQSFDITFQAPRFDADGKKTANAKFVKVVHNGVLIHENVEVPGPNAGRSLGGAEKPLAPLFLQGTQAPIAYRNLRLKSTGDK